MKLEFVWHKITFFLGSGIGIKYLRYSRIGKCLNVIAIRRGPPMGDNREYTQKKI